MNKILRIVSFACILILPIILTAQTTREEIYKTIEKSGGVYYAYPEVNETYTTTPIGYEPFYISHYGRHGSRWLISDEDYLWVMKALDEAQTAGVLSEKGKDIRRRLDIVWKDAEGMGGELTPLGVRQHQEIAERMSQNFPEIFKGSRSVSARSTVVIRCVLSMTSFCGRLKELNPSLNITTESGQRYMRYLNYWDEPAREFTGKGEWRTIYDQFREDHIHPERLMELLFTDQGYVEQHIDAKELMMGLYWIASDMQNVEIDLSFYDIFEKEELFDISQIHNFKFYVCNGTCPWGKDVVLNTFKPLLRNILDSADEAIKDNTIAATLRFGHDGNITPLAGILELENCANEETDPAKFYQVWSDFKIAPMAANIQIVFYRNKQDSDDILVKFLHNEKEVTVPVKTDFAPYYRWEDVNKYYRNKLVIE